MRILAILLILLFLPFLKFCSDFTGLSSIFEAIPTDTSDMNMNLLSSWSQRYQNSYNPYIYYNTTA